MAADHYLSLHPWQMAPPRVVSLTVSINESHKWAEVKKKKELKKENTPHWKKMAVCQI